MRINPNPYPDLLNDIALTQQQINSDEQQIASGQSVNVPSDNPAAAAILVQNADATSRADQFERSIGSIQGEMQSADSTLNSVISSLQQAITLGTEGANGTVNAADRSAITVQLQGIQSQLVSLANLTYQGSYVFGGTATQTAPYVLDPTSTSGVTYQGNSNVNRVTLGNGFTLQTNLPGSQLFSAAGNSMFQSIQDLINDMESGNNIGTAVTEVGSALNYVDSQRVFYGNALNQLTAQQTYLSSETTSLAEQQNTVGGADLTVVISNLTNSQVSLEATLQTIGKTAQINLFDYIR
ncbi:MAG TPA: flagellar hook-associated protein 3 [Candidatus Binatia bacterium]|nr:flagellar hook-associated protein 3 [Candidatus Binatia bacterium]